MNSSVECHKGLISLPTEVRILIWERTVDWSCVHILEDGFVRCNSNGLIPGHTINDCHRHRRSMESVCTTCPKTWSVGVAGTCWLFYREISTLRYRKTLFCFANSHCWTNFVQAQLDTTSFSGFTLGHLRQVQLEMGAAKHNHVKTNMQNKVVLKRLATEAHNLEVLNLNFMYYHRGESDLILLSREVLSCILLFHHLKDLNLRLYQTAPGPLGIPSLNEDMFSKVLTQWKSLELILKILTCQHYTFKNLSKDRAKDQEVADPIVSQMSKRNIKSLREAVHSLLLSLAADT